jgi:hypothetical protein
MARHFHYAPEISAAFFWTVPALFSHVSIAMLLLFMLNPVGLICTLISLRTYVAKMSNMGHRGNKGKRDNRGSRVSSS